MMKSSRLYHMVLAGVLCAVGIVVPMFMPRIVLYYGSFRRVFRHLDEDELRTEMRRVLRHEFRHHVEGRAGVRDLEEWDADQIRAYRARKDAE